MCGDAAGSADAAEMSQPANDTVKTAAINALKTSLTESTDCLLTGKVGREIS